MKSLRSILLVLFAGCGSASAAPPHRYDHVVIVIEENESQTRVIGNRVDAPYLNGLADGGVNFTQFYAITHPSQPNYLHFFSGNHQGILDNNLPPNLPFNTPNLGAALIDAGFSFAGFSEDLPAIGDSTTIATSSQGLNRYARRHNPWANWQAPLNAPSIPPNQLAGSTNRRFADFPSDFSLLPAVSIVIPNVQNDMHDGTIRMADDWLLANLGAYARWARTHNSLLVVTFDEDDYSGPNKIPTVMYGAGLTPGTVDATTWTLHHFLRTLCDSYAVAPPALAAQVSRINGALPKDRPVLTVRFQTGVGEYGGCVDTILNSLAPFTNYASLGAVYVSLDADAQTAGNQPIQTLIRFQDLFGASPGQIPAAATILSAKLVVRTVEPINDAVEAHRMLTPWEASATWNSLSNGISADGVEAVAAPTFSLAPSVYDAPLIFDVTSDIEAWQGGSANQGWALLGTGNQLWNANASEVATVEKRPLLEVSYTLPVASGYPSWQLAKFGTNAGNPGTLPMDDPDHDGTPNFAEYGVNSHPLVASSEGLPRVEFGGGLHHFTFARNLAATDIKLEVQANTDAGTAPWTTAATWTPANGWTPSPGFTVTDYVGAVEITETIAQARFFRVVVTAL